MILNVYHCVLLSVLCFSIVWFFICIFELIMNSDIAFIVMFERYVVAILRMDNGEVEPSLSPRFRMALCMYAWYGI